MNGFGAENLPLGVARLPGGETVCVSAFGDDVINLAHLAAAKAIVVPEAVLRTSSLNRFLALGREVWRDLRRRLADLVAAGDGALADSLVPRDSVSLFRPVDVGDFVDFSASLHHATNMAGLLRPGSPPPGEEWKRFPRGYQGRANTIVVSGTPVVRPHGPTAGEGPLRPTTALDGEAEVGFVIGRGNRMGHPIAKAEAEGHIAGLLLILDWTARDVQMVESQPLGPFLSKSFATSVSPWLVSLDAVDPAAIELEVVLAGTTISRPTFDSMYWSIAELLTYATANGAATRPGDLFGCGTVSGPGDGRQGCLAELSWGGSRPLHLDDGSSRRYLEDGDSLVVRGWAGSVSFGEVAGTVLGARPEGS